MHTDANHQPYVQVNDVNVNCNAEYFPLAPLLDSILLLGLTSILLLLSSYLNKVVIYSKNIIL